MNKIIGDTRCPSCTDKGKDRTGNHLIIFDNGNTFCNKCGYKGKINTDNIKAKKEKYNGDIYTLLKEFKSKSTVAWPARGLTKKTIEKYSAKANISCVDNKTILSYLLPYCNKDLKICGYKVRLAEEKVFWNVGNVKEAVFFGQQLLSSNNVKKLFITEAPIDAMSLYQAIKESWKGTKFEKAEPNVISLPHGTGSAVNTFYSNEELISNSDEIILVFDSDKAGMEAVEKVCSLYPKIKYVKLPLKDANEMLMNKRGSELAKLAFFSSVEIKIDGMGDIYDLVEEISDEPLRGTAYPWKKMTELTYGMKPQEIIGLCSGVGMGKTDVKNELTAWFALKGDHVTVFDLEYSYKNTGKLLASKVASKAFHRPDSGYTKEDIKKAIEPLKGLVQLYKHRGSRGWEEIKKCIRYSVIVNNSKVIMIDPITALIAHLTATEANDELNKIFSEISALEQELDFTVFYFAHLNNPRTGVSHERGGKINESQMTGSRAMMRWSTHIWGLEGNKDPDIPGHERNTRRMILLKDREYGNVGSFYLSYNKETTRLIERF